MSPRLLNTLRPTRESRGLSQQRLADLTGISRQSYGALESGASVPSAEVALRLAAALGCPVESLFRLPEADAPSVEAIAVGDLPPGGAPVRVVRIGGRLHAWRVGGAADGGMGPASGPGIPLPEGRVRVELLPEVPPEPELVVVGCDPSFALVAAHLRRRGIEVLHLHMGSRKALEALAAGQAHVAGVHLLDPESGAYNGPWVARLVPFPCLRVGYAVWAQDLLVRPEGARKVRSLVDLTRRGLRFANREPGSGTRTLVEARLREVGVDPSEVSGFIGTEAPGHLAVAQAVASGCADAGVAIRAVGRACCLRGIPLAEERYDLVIPEVFLDLPAVQALLDALRAPSLRAQVELLGGYDLATMGEPA
jgi:putative molybdopterin biosynthesis protein